MRTTLNLDHGLLAQAELLAQQTDATLDAVVEDALRERLERHRAPAPSRAVQLPTVGGNGLRPGVDLDDSAALREVMDVAP
ncbi:MAG: type II toxin-antitoxin system VapB family antitoxin [Chloroflexota bacterium]|nr:type II toxin-antitoxin system VapB family antitoxin [Chloroflexota bacterium]